MATAKKSPVKKPAAKSAAKPAAKPTAKKVAPKILKDISAEERMEAPKKVVKKSPAPAQKAAAEPYFYANGKRKTSVSMIRLSTNGKGTITVNGRAFEAYFPVFTDQDKIIAPLRVTNTQKMFDVSVQVSGGGIHSQAEAVRHGIAKALLEYSAPLRSTLKPLGFLTRDPRVKERKKYGLHRARRAPQFSKR